jgi:hypothetical protein
MHHSAHLQTAWAPEAAAITAGETADSGANQASVTATTTRYTSAAAAATSVTVYGTSGSASALS